MLDLETRTAILRLHQEGHRAWPIAKALGIGRTSADKIRYEGISLLSA